MAASNGEQLFADEAQTDDVRPLGFVEVADDGVAHHCTKFVEVIGFREDRLTECVGGVATFGSLVHEKYDLC